MKNTTLIARLILPMFLLSILLIGAPSASAKTVTVYGENLVFNNGTLDGILAEGETEKTLNGDWGVSYPVATFGGPNGDSPAKVKNIDGNNVLVLEYSAGSGTFASFFADLSHAYEHLPAGKYELSLDLKAVGTNFSTDNIGYNLYNQYTDVRVWLDGWQNVTEGNDGWMHYTNVLEITDDAQFVDSIQMWFNTLGKDPAECALYIDNICIRTVSEEEVPDELPKTGDGFLMAAIAGCALSIAGVVTMRKKEEV